MIVASVHPWKTIELFYYLMKYDYQDVIYFDTFPKREPAAEECRLNRQICAAIEDKLKKIGLDSIGRIIGSPEGSPACALMLEWMK